MKLESDPPRLRRTTQKLALYVYTLSLVGALLLSLLAEEFIHLMASRPTYWDAWIIVPPVAFAYALHALGNFLNIGITMADRPWILSTNLMLSGAVNILLNFLLIPVCGIMGAALATLITYFGWNALKAYQSARLYDLHFDWRRINHVSAITLLLLALGLTAANFLSMWPSVAFKLVTWAALPGLLWLTGFVNSEEKAQLAALYRRIRPGKAAKEAVPTG